MRQSILCPESKDTVYSTLYTMVDDGINGQYRPYSLASHPSYFQLDSVDAVTGRVAGHFDVRYAIDGIRPTNRNRAYGLPDTVVMVGTFYAYPLPENP